MCLTEKKDLTSAEPLPIMRSWSWRRMPASAEPSVPTSTGGRWLAIGKIDLLIGHLACLVLAQQFKGRQIEPIRRYLYSRRAQFCHHHCLTCTHALTNTHTHASTHFYHFCALFVLTAPKGERSILCYFQKNQSVVSAASPSTWTFLLRCLRGHKLT